MLRTLMSLMVVLPLLIGTNNPCPEPDYPHIEDCPFPVDPNMVKGKLLGWLQIEVGESLVHTRTWCDPDGDTVKVKIVEGPEGLKLINKPRITSYTLLWRPRQLTTTAIVLEATDDPVVGLPKSDVGTLLVQVVPPMKRSRSGGCGGRPG